MRSQHGFSLIELLIVVAVILIIAAIAIPVLLAARIAANEAATVADTRTILSAEVTFQGATGGYGTLACLGAPATCYTGAGPIPLIDPFLASGADKSGYRRVFQDNGVAVAGPKIIAGVFAGFCYGGMPVLGGRSFGGDGTGVIVENNQGMACCLAGENNTAVCSPLSQ